MKKILVIIILSLLYSNTSNASFEWIKNQTEYTDANQLFFDSEKRFLKLIESNVSSKSFPPFTGTEGTLIEKFKRILGGPPNEVAYYEDKRYVVTSSCEARACPVKAFVFIDTKEKIIEVAAGIRNKNFSPKTGKHCDWCDYKALACPAWENS